jgi:glycosyltransferase involved in cell wall biosynthesis
VRQLLAAWRLLDTDLVLRIIGDGPQRAELEAEAPSGVVFEGALSQQQVSEALATTRLVVLPYQPSLRQASSLAALEAASHGRPVVVGDDPAVVEILRRTGGGLAVDARDPQKLAAAISSYLTDGDRCDREGTAMQSNVLEHYSPAAVARRSREIYELAMAR